MIEILLSNLWFKFVLLGIVLWTLTTFMIVMSIALAKEKHDILSAIMILLSGILGVFGKWSFVVSIVLFIFKGMVCFVF